VDPLDGATNYAHELPIFTVSVALEKAGEVTAGAVYSPMAEEIYAAERDGGVTLNGQSIEASATDELIQALLASSFSSDREDISATLDLFGKFADRRQRRKTARYVDTRPCATLPRDGWTDCTSAASRRETWR
jgi:myo-inositol-1(or 4)-monophosphatase